MSTSSSSEFCTHETNVSIGNVKNYNIYDLYSINLHFRTKFDDDNSFYWWQFVISSVSDSPPSHRNNIIDKPFFVLPSDWRLSFSAEELDEEYPTSSFRLYFRLFCIVISNSISFDRFFLLHFRLYQTSTFKRQTSILHQLLVGQHVVLEKEKMFIVGKWKWCPLRFSNIKIWYF